MEITFKNRLFEYILYCTEININLLLNTSNFHHKFQFVFSSILSKNAPNVHFREAKSQNFQGTCPRTPLVLSHLQYLILFLPDQQWVIITIILRILIAQKHFSIFTRKGCTFRIIQRYILRTADIIRSTQAQSAPPSEKAAYAPD